MAEGKLLSREEVDPKYKWKIEDLFATDELWEKEYNKLKKLFKQYEKYPGTLGESKEKMLEFFTFSSKVNLLFERLYVYANQRLHEDLANAKYQKYAGMMQNAMVEMSGLSSFAEPEILEISEEKIKEYMQSEDMKPHRKYLTDLLRMKEHILDKKTEEILAKSQNMSSAPDDIFAMFNGADIKFPSVKDENGTDVELTHGTYSKFMESKDRRVRKDAFMAMYETYGSMKNTLAATYKANLNQAAFYADVRGYSSTRAMYLADSNVPEQVYDNLIQTVHDNMNLMYRYLELRKKALGLDELHMYDLYTPMAEGSTNTYSFDEAKEIVLKGLAPMGDEYLSVLKNGMGSGWIDVYENKGKRSGAYSWGAYGTHPYVLLNYNGTLDNVFTLAHEMGHALHSYFSDANQPFETAGYKIFVAEVASTCNESLLIHYLLKNTDDKNEKIYLINRFLEQFKGTLYRQTMFAEFEKITHQMVADGETLTADLLCNTYYNLNKLYFGEGICIDKEIALEWSRIPHFYTPFYVYQYATGISAAIALSKKIMHEGETGVKDYMKFLTGGGSKDPIDLLKLAGVDMTTPAPVEEALGLFGELLDEMEELIG